MKFNYKGDAASVETYMKTSGCKMWGMIPGIRGAWCWIDESDSCTGVVITFLSKLGLESFINEAPHIAGGARGGMVNSIVENFKFYDKSSSNLVIEVHEQL